MIRLESVNYRYPYTKKAALTDLDLAIPEGQFCAIVGGNEAGKSTLSYLLTGFIPHHFKGTLSGQIEVAGIAVRQSNLGELAGVVGLVFSNPFNQITGARFTVREEIAFGLENLGIPRKEMVSRIEQVMELTGIDQVAERSPLALSGGQQQRVALASMLVMQPRVLVLDEPTSQLDPSGKKEVFAILDKLTAAREMTVILTDYELEWIGTFADRVVVLDGGRIVADGKPREVLAAEELLSMGVGNTRFTEAIRYGVDKKVIPGRNPLPVTLEETVEYLNDEMNLLRGNSIS